MVSGRHRGNVNDRRYPCRNSHRAPDDDRLTARLSAARRNCQALVHEAAVSSARGPAMTDSAGSPPVDAATTGRALTAGELAVKNVPVAAPDTQAGEILGTLRS